MQSPAPLTFLAATKRPHEHPMGLGSGPGPRMVQGRSRRQAGWEPGLLCSPPYHQVLTGPVLVEWEQTETQTLQTYTYASRHVAASAFPHVHLHCSHNSQLFHLSKHGRRAATAVFPQAPGSCMATGIWGKLQQGSQEYVEGRALSPFYLQHLYISGHFDLALAGPQCHMPPWPSPPTLTSLYSLLEWFDVTRRVHWRRGSWSLTASLSLCLFVSDLIFWHKAPQPKAQLFTL